MKIAIMTRWNVPSGQSAHAEPLGQAWLEMGHQLKVFAPQGIDLLLAQQDEKPFVHRCYFLDGWDERKRSDYLFDPRPFLEEDYEIFLVEMMQFMPMPELLGIFPHIKKKAKTILIVSEQGLPQDPNWYKFDWDATVCFDTRFRGFVVKAFPKAKAVIIPFPCHPPLHGDRREARIRLDLPLDKRIVFAYGFNTVHNHIDLFPVMERLSRNYPFLFLLLTHHGEKLVTSPDFLLLRDEMPTLERLYAYLHASDAYVYYVRKGDGKIEGVGVSSSVAACLGAGRPILVPSYCNFFDLSGKEVLKYGDLQDLEQGLQDVFDGAEGVKESLRVAEEYATRNSISEIAARFIELFSEIRGNLHSAKA